MERLMGCPPFCMINGTLAFSIFTHDPDTFGVRNADESPLYKVFESGTEGVVDGGLIDSGNMVKLAGGIGLYSKKLDITEANGYEEGKRYVIYIQISVEEVIGAMSYEFEVCPESSGWRRVLISGLDGQRSVQINGRMKDL